jgi:hypothetical protein
MAGGRSRKATVDPTEAIPEHVSSYYMAITMGLPAFA